MFLGSFSGLSDLGGRFWKAVEGCELSKLGYFLGGMIFFN